MSDVEITVSIADREPVEVEITTATRGPQGLSTYDLWLQAGNEGSIDDFLASLHGAPTFVQESAPTYVTPYSWWQTGLGDGDGLTLWIEDGQ